MMFDLITVIIITGAVHWKVTGLIICSVQVTY